MRLVSEIKSGQKLGPDESDNKRGMLWQDLGTSEGVESDRIFVSVLLVMQNINMILVLETQYPAHGLFVCSFVIVLSWNKPDSNFYYLNSQRFQRELKNAILKPYFLSNGYVSSQETSSVEDKTVHAQKNLWGPRL